MNFHQIITTLILLVFTSLIIKLFLNRKIRISKLIQRLRLILDKFHDHQFLQIPEFNSNNFQQNNLFYRTHLYLNSIESLQDSDFTHLFSSGYNQNDVVLTLNPKQLIVDTFLDARLLWICCDAEGSNAAARSFTLKIRKRDKRRILRAYIQHIHVVTDEIIDSRERYLRLFTIVSGTWQSVPFTHPATMDTIVINVDVKNKIKQDIDVFLKSKQYYNRLGRVWRRSYLLYGQSGTGKSSFVASIAKTLSYDVYDFDQARVSDEADLKALLLRTTPKSIILLEDFDKYLAGNISMSRNLSTVMDFMDGLVNSCCDERVFIFTMISKYQINPDILRPGRIDVHVHFPMCDFNSFKLLASNYLGLKEHKLFPQVEDIFLSGATLSPAEIGELMMVNRNSPNRALKSVISALQTTGIKGVGGGESCKEMSGNGVKPGRVSVDGERESVDGGVSGVGFKDGAKEFRKLYSLLRRKSASKSGSFDLGT